MASPEEVASDGDRLPTTIRYIGKIWDGRQKVKSPTVWDFSDIWKPALFSRRIPGFCDDRRLFPTYENSISYRRGRSGWTSLITNPLLLDFSPPITHKHGVPRGSCEWWRQTSDDYPIYRQNLGRSAKSKIPDRLGFFRHMKTSLNGPQKLTFEKERTSNKRNNIKNSL